MAKEWNDILVAARAAQATWAQRTVQERSHFSTRLAKLLSLHRDELVAANPRPNSDALEKLFSEVMPLADACTYNAKIAKSALRSVNEPRRGVGLWMGRISVKTQRAPWGLVLIIAPSNYPLYLAGAQAVQALIAGNAVLIKPAPGCERILQRFRDLVVESGVREELITILDSDIQTAEHVIERGVHKVILTGSAKTGSTVARKLGEKLIPSAMELSGCDAVYVLPSADLRLVAKAVAFALPLNGGATCIGPRRLFVSKSQAAELRTLLKSELSQLDQGRTFQIPNVVASLRHDLIQQALGLGATVLHGDDSSTDVPEEPTSQIRTTVLSDVDPAATIANEDLFAPVLSVIPVATMEQALSISSSCPYALAASVFGAPHQANAFAQKLEVGCIVINDCVAPTADPRVAFGGRGRSGWGVTRGREGLVQMTQPVAVVERKGRWLPHLNRKQSTNVALVNALFDTMHGSSLRIRVVGALKVLRAAMRG